MARYTPQFLVLLSFLAVGCGEEDDDSPATGGSAAAAGAASGGNAGTAGKAGTGGGGSAGDGGNEEGGTGGTSQFIPDQGCRTDEGCTGDQGGTCFRFGEEGPGFCGTPPSPVTECAQENPDDECCSSEECTDARCVAVVTQPVQCSSTAGFDVVNQCLADACESDEDCDTGFCSPENLGPRVCVPAACKSDSDCDADAGGVCAYFNLGCCGQRIGGAPTRAAEIACVYPGGCQDDADCPSGERCVVHEGRAQCSASCP